MKILPNSQALLTYLSKKMERRIPPVLFVSMLMLANFLTYSAVNPQTATSSSQFAAHTQSPYNEAPYNEDSVPVISGIVTSPNDENPLLPCRLSYGDPTLSGTDCEGSLGLDYFQQLGPIIPPAEEPIDLDPIVGDNSSSNSEILEIKKLLASDAEAGDRFGKSVAISGSTAIVGAELWDNGTNLYQGSAYIFEQDHGGANNWGEIKQLITSDGQQGDACSYDVAIEGDTAVILCPYHDVNGTPNQGAAYVFERNEGGTNNWGESAILTASDGASQDVLGASVIIQGDTIVIGGDWVDVNGNTDQGAVYIFERDTNSSNGWSETAKLTASDGLANDLFGWDIAMIDDRIIVGAPRADISGNTDQGAAYVYEYDTVVPNQWSEVQKLVATDGGANEQFGWSTAIDEQKITVGARLATVGPNANQGAAYIYTLVPASGTTWTQIRKLTASDGSAGDQIGQSLAKDLNLSLSGAYFADVVGGFNQGAVYLFSDSLDSIWSNAFVGKLVASDAAQNDYFGWATGGSGDFSVSGAYRKNGNQGAAYIHDVSSFGVSTPAEATLTSPTGTINDQSPDFVWQALNTATSYTIVVYSIDANAIVHSATHFAIDVCDIVTFICTAELPSGFTLSSGDFTWLIASENSAGVSVWSTP